MKSKETLIKSAAILSFSALTAAAAFVLLKGWAGGHFSSMDSLRSYVASYGISGPLVLMEIQALQVILPVLPGFFGCIVGAALYGAAAGFWINYIGISAGSIAAYFLAKRYGIRLVDKMISVSKYESYIQKLNQSRRYSVILFLAILLPLAPDDFLCYFSGLLNMPAGKFIAIIITAKPWCILFYSVFFAHFL